MCAAKQVLLGDALAVPLGAAERPALLCPPARLEGQGVTYFTIAVIAHVKS